MHDSADRVQKKQNKASANERARSEEATLEVVDNRAETAQLRKLQAAADNNSRAGWIAVGNAAVARKLDTKRSKLACVEASALAGTVQRVVFDGPDIATDVTNFARNGEESWQSYQARFKANYAGAPRNYKKNWKDNRATVKQKFEEIHCGQQASEQVTTETVRSETGKTMLQLEHMNASQKKSEASGFMGQYTSAGKTVSFAGKTATVYDIGGGHWGYLDLQHGEIEVIAANQTSGTTLGFKTITFNYNVIKKTIAGQETFIIDITASQAGPLVRGKLHTYTLK